MRRFLFLLLFLTPMAILATPNITGSSNSLDTYFSFDGSLRDYKWLQMSARTAVHQGSGSVSYSTDHPSVIVSNSGKAASIAFGGDEYLDVDKSIIYSLL